MAKAAAKKKPAAPRKPAARKAPAKPASRPRKPRGGIIGDLLGLRAGFRPSFQAMLARGIGEERMFAYLAISCFVAFLAGLPQAIDMAANMPQEDALVGLVAGRFVAWLIFGSLFMYGLAAASHAIAFWGFRGKGTYAGARLALFWALFLAIPLGILSAALTQVLQLLGLTGLTDSFGILIFFFWLWLWTGFFAIAEGFPRGSVFLVALAVCACLTGFVWLLNAAT